MYLNIGQAYQNQLIATLLFSLFFKEARPLHLVAPLRISCGYCTDVHQERHEHDHHQLHYA